MDLAAVGKRVKALRLGRGLTQPKLAARAGLHKNTISNLERGRSRSIETGSLGNIAKALGVSDLDLITNTARSKRSSAAGPSGPSGR